MDKKKILLYSAAGVGGLLVVLIVAVLILGAISGGIDRKRQQERELSNSRGTYNFFEPNRSVNILEEQEYLGLDRRIGYKYYEVTMYEPEYYSDAAAFVADALTDVIRGDHASYCARLSKTYLNRALYNEEFLEDFTMQRLYGILIEFLGEAEEKSGNNTVVRTQLKVDYMIRKNDGLFRNDMGSDMIRAVVYTVVKVIRPDGAESMYIEDVLLY